MTDTILLILIGTDIFGVGFLLGSLAMKRKIKKDIMDEPKFDDWLKDWPNKNEPVEATFTIKDFPTKDDDLDKELKKIAYPTTYSDQLRQEKK